MCSGVASDFQIYQPLSLDLLHRVRVKDLGDQEHLGHAEWKGEALAERRRPLNPGGLENAAG